MKTVKLADLLKMWECQQCYDSYKERGKVGKLLCGWDNNDEKIPCCKTPQCGNWPEFYNDVMFNQIKILR